MRRVSQLVVVISGFVALVTLGAAGLAPTTYAAEPSDDGRTHGDYMGAFWGVELRGGIALRGGDDELTPIGAMGLGLRIATLVSLIDFELGSETMGFSRRAHDLRLTSIAGELRVHPLFIRLLQGNTGSLVLASIHLALGAGPDRRPRPLRPRPFPPSRPGRSRPAPTPPRPPRSSRRA